MIEMVKKLDYTDQEKTWINDWFTWINQTLLPYVKSIEKRLNTVEKVNVTQDATDKRFQALIDGLQNVAKQVETAKATEKTET
jgi:hypothetical protein